MLAVLLSFFATAAGQGLPPMDSPAPAQLASIAQGPFEASLDSLRKNRYPKWFTEGKLGIWAHWGPQAVPMEGDWYARQMYEEGSKDYKDHLTRWGHPSQHGYKDIIPLWKAEKWDPDRLMALYNAAGAKYFVSMGVHHDNFDLWNSTYHRWNAVKMGPHRDVVGDWQKAARKEGLRFGVSEHLGASWTWFQKSRGADKEGDQKGVPYDGNDPAFEDLYHPRALASDEDWYSKDPRWHAEWYRRIKDLVDQYHPDLLYSDGPLPFGNVGESLVAHFYNATMKDGKQQGVYTCKQRSEGRWATDLERGVMGGIQPYPWQTDTSIGDWFYNKNWKFRGADWVLQTLVDVVSKNGNLLINVVQRPDGSLDPDAEKVLADMAAWMKVNSESIYGTRPWRVYGEGAAHAKGGSFKEDFGFTSRDVRYVEKAEGALALKGQKIMIGGIGTIYATLMRQPEERQILLRSLAKHDGDQAQIEKVEVLGYKGRVNHHWDRAGLRVELPELAPSDLPLVFKIRGVDLGAFNSIPDPFPKPPVPVVKRDASGAYLLKAEFAEVPDEGVHPEMKDGQTNLGYWDNPQDTVSWNVNFAEPGTYEASAVVAGLSPTSLDINVVADKLTLKPPPTGDYAKFAEVKVGTIRILQAGKAKVVARPASDGSWRPLNLRVLTFRKLP
jgi:alpha-L-fucosidase